jgi:hypothetical protein
MHALYGAGVASGSTALHKTVVLKRGLSYKEV